MTDTDGDETEKRPLPRAHLANQSRRERCSRPIRWLKYGMLALVPIVVAGSLVVAIVLGAHACEAKAKEACAALNDWVIHDIMRIKRAEFGSRDVYTQAPGSSVVEMYDDRCHADFIADVPSGQPMYGVRRTSMRNETCQCVMTYHVHAITDPNVE